MPPDAWPYTHVLRMYPQYTPDLAGQDLPDHAVIRASNGRYHTPAELSRFHKRSTDRCPMYGTCQRCLASGPLGKRCKPCFEDDHITQFYVMINLRGDKVVDAEFLSAFANRPHQVAKADRMYQWGRTPQLTEMSEQRFLEWIRYKLDRGVPNRDRETREINWQRDSMLLVRLIR